MRNALVIFLSTAGLFVLPNLAPAASVTQNVADFISDPGMPTNPTPVSSSLFSIQTASVDGFYRSPFENFTGGYGPGYGSSYTSIQQGGSAVYNFAEPKTMLSLLWGSPDGANQIAFYSGPGGTGTNLFTLTGQDLTIQTYGHDQVQIDLGNNAFSSVVLTSATNSFEFANLQASDSQGSASVAAAPLPAALPLFAGGLGGMGLFAWWRKRKVKSVAAAV